MSGNVYIYIGIMAAVSFLIRVLPLTVIRKKITNRFLNSFLYYVPYATLAVMTFPAILHATNSIWSGAAAAVASTPGILGYFPVLLVSGTAAGAVVGLLGGILVRRIRLAGDGGER